MEHINLRLPKDLLDRIDSYRNHLKNTTGLEVKRSDALRVVIAVGLDVKEKEITK